ncbi:mevalonate kinase [Saccharomycopsis crataegensis]|uniref:Mevalonate kinase n=1 Tax=Saccharomycopsis crataegensis TaxID=43959 RepID=A0AAV5QGD8_9ASCO|nr:mevalonate kinase [Saccharomycopsis crataegensis]
MTVPDPKTNQNQNNKVQVPFLVSAPGKVIIFGEHSAVHGKPAIAAALSLRTYLSVSKSESPDTVSLIFPDINFSKQWKVSDFPWEAAAKYQVIPSNDGKLNNSAAFSKSSDELVPELVSALAEMLVTIDDPTHYSAAYAFVYLYVNICNSKMPGYTFTARSTLPVGAGLGSSASLAVCLASSLALIGGHIAPASLSINELVATDSPDSDFIHSWSFLAEKCIHGNPSGIDNAVACYGGAVMFQRMKSSVPSVRTAMRNFPPLKLLLTNTKQPRRTADLVAKVSALVSDFPKSSGVIMDAIDYITREGYKLMIRPFFDNEAKSRFRELIRMNHGLLVSLGVSHPTLERVKLCCDELEIGDTKLTGAGGGGCAITLLRDELSESTMKNAEARLVSEGFETFETTLGGKGVGYCPLDKAADVDKFDLFRLEDREEIESTVGVGANPNFWSFW